MMRPDGFLTSPFMPDIEKKFSIVPRAFEVIIMAGPLFVSSVFGTAAFNLSMVARQTSTTLS